MISLAIDTSGTQGSLALIQGQELLDKVLWNLPNKTKNAKDSKARPTQRHSEVITAQLDQLLKANKLSPNQIKEVLVGLGPGSFTGCRVAVNLARALCYSLSIPAVGTSSLEALAYPVLKNHPNVLILTNAFKNMVYICAFQDGHLILEPQAMTLPQLESYSETLSGKNWVISGGGFKVYKEHLSTQFQEKHSLVEGLEEVDAYELGMSILSSDKINKKMSWNEIKPLYLRASEAEENLRKGLLNPKGKVKIFRKES